MIEPKDETKDAEITRLRAVILHASERNHPYSPHACSGCEMLQVVLIEEGNKR